MFRDRDGEDAASEEPVFRLAEGSGIVMRSEEAQVGKRVRIRNDHLTSNLRGQEGIIARRWGNPYYTALDVLFDDGNWELFWFHELDEVDEEDRGVRCSERASAGP